MPEVGPRLNGCDDGGYMKGFVVFVLLLTFLNALSFLHYTPMRRMGVGKLVF